MKFVGFFFFYPFPDLNNLANLGLCSVPQITETVPWWVGQGVCPPCAGSVSHPLLTHWASPGLEER